MALTPTAAWTTAFSAADVKPVLLFTLDLGGGTTHKARRGWSSDTTIAGYADSLASLTSVRRSLDVFTRKVSVDTLTLQFLADGWMKNIAVANRLKNKSVTIKIGTQALAESDYLAYFAGVIDGSPKSHRNGMVEMKCASAWALLRDREVVGYWGNLHPLEVIADILVKAGVPSALYDSTTLDPSDSRFTTISHFCIQRGGGKASYHDELAVRKPTSAMQLIEEVCSLMNGALVCEEDGKIRFKLYDSTASSQADWTHNDIDHDNFEIDELDENLINRCTVTFSRNSNMEYVQHHQEDDTTSQSNNEYPDGTDKIVSKEFSTDWIEAKASSNGNAVNFTASVPGTGQTFKASSVQIFGFCGSRFPGFPSGSQPAWAKPTNSRTAYIRIDDEIIEVKDVTVSTTTKFTDSINNPYTNVVDNVTWPNDLTFTVKTRGALGTTAAAHTVSTNTLWDFTIPALMVRARLERFADGAPIIRCKTSLRYLNLQVADLITLTTDKYFHYGISTLDTNTKWEIIGKSVSFDGNDIGIEWTLAWSSYVTPPTRTYVAVAKDAKLESIAINAEVAANFEIAFKKYVTGFDQSKSTFTLSITAGKYSTVPTSVKSKDATTFTCTASKDTYVYIDGKSGGWITKETTVGAGEPTRETSLISICCATTSGAAITSILDMRNQETVKGALIVQATVAPFAIAAKVVMSTSITKNANFQAFTKG